MTKKGSEETNIVEKNAGEYRVLARKYRPQNFSQLQGQDALVRTLSNAIESGRIAHAFMLTGVRGVGKTTTARIIARALNCEKGPTINPCGVCEQCKSISEDRNMDVLELDAASRNKVEDIRGLIDAVQYASATARYKIFILDEVHMLSSAAFNALLKTLEEPPPHVKFVFATTEIRKVPVTILSRCQRFDLKRIGADVLQKYFAETILPNEKIEAEEGAIALIARAADGSARDGLSLLDQAISREPGKITEANVRDMLGRVDRSATLDLYETLMKGAAPEAMARLDVLYKDGADPMMVMQDLLDLTHYLTKVKVSPDIARDQALPEAERVRGAALSQTLSMPVLARAWQMLSKGVVEVMHAPNPQNALEMVLIRLMFVADQPSPSDVLKQLKDGSVVSAGGGVPASSSVPRGTTIMSRTAAAPMVAAIALPEQQQEVAALNNLQDVAALFAQKREMLLQSSIVSYVHLVKFEQGHIALRLKAGAPQNLIGQMTEKLQDWMGQRWIVSLSREQGEPTIGERREAEQQGVMAEVKAHPVVAEVLKVFPGTNIVDIRNKAN